MEAPPLTASTPASTTTTPTPPFYSDSVDSSPRSRKAESLDGEPPPPKLRLMCSYGGHIVPRPHDKSLCYVGGDTRIIVIDRHTSLSDLHRRLSKNLLDNHPFSLKYQLPSEDLDSLISVSGDEDFENMVEEYDRLNSAGGGGKRGRLRLFLFPKSSSSSNIDQLTSSNKSEDWFFNALNGQGSSGSDRGFSDTSSVNCLLGLDDDLVGKARAVVEKDGEAQLEGSKTGGAVNGNFNGNFNGNQDVHSVPGSPMLETSSSFGSTSSSPSVANLPHIRVRVEENLKVKGAGIEEQFQQMSVGVVVGNGNGNNGNGNSPLPQKQEESGAFMAVVPGLPAVVGGEYANRVFSDDERSDHGGYRKVQYIQPQVQAQLQQHQIPQLQQKQQTSSAFDLPSPDSVSSEGSTRNPQSRQRQANFQEPLIQIQPGNTGIPFNQADLKIEDQNNTKIQMQQQQFQESGYVLPAQYDQNHPQSHQSQQFFHSNNQYIPAGAVPMASYYPIYPSQQQQNPHQPILDQQQYPVYFMSGRQQTQAYNLPGYGELGPQSRIAPSSKPEMAGGVYRTATTGGLQFVQVPSSQHQGQYVGYTQIPHPSSATANSTYSYEYADPNHAPMYYTPVPHQLAAQYQTMTTSAPTVVAPEASAQLHTENNAKQQVRNSQP